MAGIVLAVTGQGSTGSVESEAPSGLEATYLDNRDALLRFLRARGAGDAAEDLLHEVWLRISRVRSGPVASPLAYLYSVANMAMIDRHRSAVQAARRDAEWSGTRRDREPSPEAGVADAQEVASVLAVIERLGPRAATAFRRHRIDGIGQRQVADELGISLSTVESDLRGAYRALLEWRERRDAM